MSRLKIESWRVEELAILLDTLATALESGGNREWARVFRHFLEEAQGLRLAEVCQTEEIRRLIRNISLCLRDSVTLPDLSLNSEAKPNSGGTNLSPVQAKARLVEALAEINSRLVEYVN